MKILTEISEGTLRIGDFEFLNTKYRLRKSARAILLDSNGNMATQYLQKYSFHKLPGGGVEQNENIEEALKREILEEVGCNCEILNEVGVVIEYRNKQNLLQISYCFTAKVVGKIGESKLEKGEIEEGQITLWLPPKEVLARIKTDKPKKFEGYFILKREMSFLEEYINTNFN